MPRLFKRGSVWWAWGYDENGRRWRASTKQRDRRAAERVARDLDVQRALPPDVPPLRLDTALDWLEDARRRMRRSDATMKFIEEKGGHLQRIFGDAQDVTQLRLEDTERYLDTRRGEGVTDHTISKELGVLRSALLLARRHDRYRADPAHIWPEALHNVYTPRDRWLDAGEYQALLAQLTPYRRDYVIVYCHTGVRYNELYQLEARHLDKDGRRIWVEGTKTRASRRWIPLSDPAFEVLERRAREYPEGPLFPGRWYKHKMRLDLADKCAKASIAPVTANDLRRTFASWLANRGVPEIVTLRLMGHTSSTMVRRVYAQLSRDTLAAAVDGLPTVANVCQTGASRPGHNGRGGSR